MTTIIPKKWELLPANHPTVLRRIVRELNRNFNGFYTNGLRAALGNTVTRTPITNLDSTGNKSVAPAPHPVAPPAAQSVREAAEVVCGFLMQPGAIPRDVVLSLQNALDCEYRARRARRRKEAVAALDALKKEETP